MEIVFKLSTDEIAEMVGATFETEIEEGADTRQEAANAMIRTVPKQVRSRGVFMAGVGVEGKDGRNCLAKGD
jgi:hypothetical protein